MSETRHASFDGHHVAYRVVGEGPALVVLNLYRRREDLLQLRMLSGTWQVFEIAPLGYGRSDRVPGYAGVALPDQILAVLDRHGVDRFIVWGYSAAGAMAACIAQGTARCAGLVCGGFAFDALTDGVMRQMDRRLPTGHPARTLWPWVRHFDWPEELATMACPALFYWGTQDRQMARRLRQTRGQLWPDGIDFAEFDGLDHGTCSGEQALRDVVIPAVMSWVTQRIGAAW